MRENIVYKRRIYHFNCKVKRVQTIEKVKSIKSKKKRAVAKILSLIGDNRLKGYYKNYKPIGKIKVTK